MSDRKRWSIEVTCEMTTTMTIFVDAPEGASPKDIADWVRKRGGEIDWDGDPDFQEYSACLARPVDISPQDAVKKGLDECVCGDCPHRPSKGGRCYVTCHWGPNQVWKQMRDGKAPHLTPDQITELFAGAVVRVGAWGDPAAAPLFMWEHLLAGVAAHTSYTHAWKRRDSQWHWCMASVDTPEERAEAVEAGWKTFRVLWDGDHLAQGEKACSAQGFKVPCFSCRKCDGKTGSVGIIPHGARLGRGNPKDQGRSVAGQALDV